MGALSVVICAILSNFFLKESLTFFVSPCLCVRPHLAADDGVVLTVIF